MKYWPVFVLFLSGIWAWSDLKAAVANIDGKLDTHLREHPQLVVRADVDGGSPSVTVDAGATVPVSDRRPVETFKKWSPEFLAAQESFCKERCGEWEGACHATCRARYYACGVVNPADPKDPGLRACVAKIETPPAEEAP